jgi:hypothetical protein
LEVADALDAAHATNTPYAKLPEEKPARIAWNAFRLEMNSLPYSIID